MNPSSCFPSPPHFLAQGLSFHLQSQQRQALAGWLSWLEHHLKHQKVVDSIPSWGPFGGQPNDVSLSPLSLSPHAPHLLFL